MYPRSCSSFSLNLEVGLIVLSAFLFLFITVLSSKACVALTHEVSVKIFAAVRARGAVSGRRQAVAASGVLSDAASVAVATLDAAALGVRPQRPNKGTQHVVDVVFKDEALLLEGQRGEERI